MVSRQRILEALRFAAVGLSGTAAYAAIAYGAIWSGLGAFPAHLLASFLSLIFSYAGQKIFTFRIRGDHRRSGARFAFATAFVVALHTGLVWVLNHFGLTKEFTLLAGILFYPPASYFMHTFWTFRRQASATPQ